LVTGHLSVMSALRARHEPGQATRRLGRNLNR